MGFDLEMYVRRLSDSKNLTRVLFPGEIFWRVHSIFRLEFSSSIQPWFYIKESFGLKTKSSISERVLLLTRLHKET